MKKLQLTGKCINGEVQYTNKDYPKKWDSFLKTAEGNDISVEWEVIDEPRHWQHKYFHGYLRYDIAKAMGEDDIWKVKEIIIKPMFLYNEVSEYSEIPNRFRKKARFITKFIKDIECLVGYVPSLSNLTYDEMRSFILQCEHVLIEDLRSHYGVGSNQHTAIEFRNKAMDIRSFK